MLLRGKEIAATDSTPKVVLNPDGVIIIKGRSLNKCADDIYVQIDNWIDDYLSDPAEITCVEINLEYFNGVNSKIFNSLLKKISNVILKNKKMVINWYYEEDDDNMMAKGENISFALNLPVNLIMIPVS